MLPVHLRTTCRELLLRSLNRMLKKVCLCWQWATVNILDWKLWSRVNGLSVGCLQLLTASNFEEPRTAVILLMKTGVWLSFWFIFTKLGWKCYKLSNFLTMNRSVLCVHRLFKMYTFFKDKVFLREMKKCIIVSLFLKKNTIRQCFKKIFVRSVLILLLLNFKTVIFLEPFTKNSVKETKLKREKGKGQI